MDSLFEAFDNPTRGHIRQLKYQIKTCVKDTEKISEYLCLIKAKADELALIGKPMDLEDLTEQILAGLTEDYKPEIDVINECNSSIAYTKLYERLLNREAMILCTGSSIAAPIVAHATDTRPRQPWWSNQNQNQSRFTNQNINQQCFSKHYLGCCQACGTQGHSTKFCPEFCIIKGSAA